MRLRSQNPRSHAKTIENSNRVNVVGLDGVELILEAEESFGISLADDETAKIVTVGQFNDAIMRELPRPEKKFCLSAVTFHKLRQTLLTVTGRERGEVRPSTRLDALMPRRQHKATWKRMEQLSGLRFPVSSCRGGASTPPSSVSSLSLLL